MTWIRTLYLYLFALLGLILITIGSVQLAGLGLRAWVFTEADAEMRIRYVNEPMQMASPDRIVPLLTDTTMEPETREALRQWAEDYRRMREQKEQIDPVKSHRQRQAAGSLALLLVGVPLYLYHWRTVRRERERAPVRTTGTGSESGGAPPA